MEEFFHGIQKVPVITVFVPLNTEAQLAKVCNVVFILDVRVNVTAANASDDAVKTLSMSNRKKLQRTRKPKNDGLDPFEIFNSLN